MKGFAIFFAVCCFLKISAQTAQAGELAYVTGYNQISVIDLTAGNVIKVIPISSPSSIVVDHKGIHAYVTSIVNNTLSVINIATNAIDSVISVGSYPVSVAINQTDTEVYVANQSDCTISVVQVATNTVTNTVPVACSPSSLAVDPSGAHVYVGEGVQVSVIDTATSKVVAVIQTPDFSGSGTHGIAVNHAGTYVYLAHQETKTISVINALTNQLVANFQVGVDPGLQNIAISPDDAFIYVTDYDGLINVIDASTNSVVNSIFPGISPEDIVISSNGATLYATSTGFENQVAVFDLNLKKALPSIRDSNINSPSLAIAIVSTGPVQQKFAMTPTNSYWTLASIIVAMLVISLWSLIVRSAKLG